MTTSLEIMLATLARSWEQQGIKVGDPASEAAVRDFEGEFRVTCPSDFATYLLTVGGMPDVGDADANQIRFWTINEIKPFTAAANAPAAGFFVFADYSISAHEYGIRLSSPDVGRVCVVHSAGTRFIAPDFTAFLSIYLNDPVSLFPK
jgi:hypothetical protein